MLVRSLEISAVLQGVEEGDGDERPVYTHFSERARIFSETVEAY